MNQVGDTVVITAHLHKDLIGLRGKVVLVIYGGYVWSDWKHLTPLSITHQTGLQYV